MTAFDCYGAACTPPAPPAAFPKLETATELDMAAARKSVRRYLADMENTLECLDAAHEDHAHALAVDDMEKTAAKFNALVQAFRARQKT